MSQRIIRICYRKIINATSLKAWDQYVFDDTYTEYLLQAQYFDKERKYSTFTALIGHVPAADKLHFLVSSALTGYLKQLNSKVPDIVNSLGKLFLPFSNYRFEIIDSDIKDKKKHQVAVDFISDELIWLDTVGNRLLVSVPANMENEEMLTEMFSMQPFLSIYSVKKIAEPQTNNPSAVV